MTTPDGILHFWFEELSEDQRFARDAAVDAAIAGRFGALHAELSADVGPRWRSAPRPLLGAVIVLDQFGRNLFRDDARAFAQDASALALTRDALERSWDADLSADERQFLYMPLMHSEVLADVKRSRALMHAAGHEAGEAFAARHAATIARFGRYPARNAALGRESTAEERAFLAEHPTGF